MSKANVPKQFYHAMGDKPCEVIRFLKDYASGDNLLKYTKFSDRNLSTEEKIMIKNYTKISEDKYISNCYILNSFNRVLVVDFEEEPDRLVSVPSFIYITDNREVKRICTFMVNKKYLEDEENLDKNLIAIAYRICKSSFKVEMVNPNSIICKFLQMGGIDRTELLTSFAKIRLVPDFYINYLISVIMVLDVMFNLRFSDLDMVYESLIRNQEIRPTGFKEIYDYTIDIHSDVEDYIKIFNKFM